MIDIKLIRNNPQLVQNAINNKNKSWIVDVFNILELDTKNRKLEQELQELSQQRKQAAKKREIEKGIEIRNTISHLEPLAREAKEQLTKMLLLVPNIPHEDVPIGKDESENQVLKQIGEIPEFDFIPKSHEEIGKSLWIINIDRAVEVAGSRFNYLIWDGAMLEYALANYATSILTDPKIIQQIVQDNNLEVSTKPFMPVIPPNFINPEVFLKMARLEPKEDRYYIESEDLYLIGSGEHTLWPIRMNEIIEKSDLPLRYFANTSCYRKEAGTYGKDTRGILRQHQFNKVEMLSYSDPENSLEEHKLFTAIQEYLVKSLWLPYQQVLLCTWDMGTPNARHVDIEIWMPSQNKYRETHSADYNTDYQARRLNIKTETNGKKEFVHMNDGTAYALWRMIIAILENNQQKDWSVVIPAVLQPYMRKIKITKE